MAQRNAWSIINVCTATTSNYTLHDSVTQRTADVVGHHDGNKCNNSARMLSHSWIIPDRSSLEIFVFLHCQYQCSSTSHISINFLEKQLQQIYYILDIWCCLHLASHSLFNIKFMKTCAHRVCVAGLVGWKS